MPDVTWPDEFFPMLMSPKFVPLNVKTALDVGCGRGMLGALLRIYREPERLVAVDSFEPYLEFVRRMRLYDEVINLDLTKSDLPFEDKSFDLVLSLEVIEHLQKKDGIRLLSQLERIGKRVIVSTPGHFFDQPKYDGNPHQSHLSFYSVDELEKRGYDIYGVGDFHVFRKRLPSISQNLSKWTLMFPRLSGTILAVRDAGPKG